MAVTETGRASFTPTAEKFGRWLDRQTDEDLTAIAAQMLEAWSTSKVRFYYHPGEDKAVLRPIVGETAIEVAVPRKQLRDSSDVVSTLNDAIRTAIIKYLELARSRWTSSAPRATCWSASRGGPSALWTRRWPPSRAAAAWCSPSTSSSPPGRWWPRRTC